MVAATAPAPVILDDDPYTPEKSLQSRKDEEYTSCVEAESVTTGSSLLVLKGEDSCDTRRVDVHGEVLYLGLVADGHGGKAASVHCKSVVLDLILAELNGPPTGTELRRAGVAAFVAAHEQLLADSSTTAGSTLTVCCVNATRSEVTTLHSGDSVARLVGSKSTALALCEDHRIDTSEPERARLGKLGAKIARAVDEHGRPAGPLRLWPKEGVGVAQARAIGDRDVGTYIEPRPHASTVALPASESCVIIIASDGVWDAMLPSAVDAIARVSMTNPANVSARLICASACAQRHAYSSSGDELPIDDTTAVVIRIEDDDDPIKVESGCCD